MFECVLEINLLHVVVTESVLNELWKWFKSSRFHQELFCDHILIIVCPIFLKSITCTVLKWSKILLQLSKDAFASYFFSVARNYKDWWIKAIASQNLFTENHRCWCWSFLTWCKDFSADRFSECCNVDRF